MKKLVNWEASSGDIAWHVQLEDAEDIVNLHVQGIDCQSGGTAVEVRVEGARHRLGDLGGILREALAHLDVTAKPRAATAKSYSVEQMRKTHRRAYLPWSPEDDDALVARFRGGVTVVELAEEFERGEGAVRSRLLKLGQVDVLPGRIGRGSAT